jgi:hypothetical protein
MEKVRILDGKNSDPDKHPGSATLLIGKARNGDTVLGKKREMTGRNQTLREKR